MLASYLPDAVFFLPDCVPADIYVRRQLFESLPRSHGWRMIRPTAGTSLVARLEPKTRISQMNFIAADQLRAAAARGG